MPGVFISSFQMLLRWSTEIACFPLGFEQLPGRHAGPGNSPELCLGGMLGPPPEDSISDLALFSYTPHILYRSLSMLLGFLIFLALGFLQLREKLNRMLWTFHVSPWLLTGLLAQLRTMSTSEHNRVSTRGSGNPASNAPGEDAELGTDFKDVLSPLFFMSLLWKKKTTLVFMPISYLKWDQKVAKHPFNSEHP